MNREAHQQRVEGRTVLGVERREELLLDLLRDPAQPYELALAVGGEADDVAAPVGRVAVPLDQAALLERVEQADELAAVDAERVCDRRLRLAVALAEEGQYAVVVGDRKSTRLNSSHVKR